MPKLPGVRSDNLPRTMRWSISETCGSRSGMTPRISAPALREPCSIASRSTYGAAPSTWGFAFARSSATGQSRTVSSTPEIVACETMPRMRSFNSLSKPFITEITVIRAVTPTAMPRIDTSEMNEMKWLRRFARV